MAGKKWILLVAGSKGWKNYRHQANVCGLYQIIKKHGIPDEQIVVMMYDDIADNPNNPENGAIISVVDDSNVYLGVPKDYTGEDVTPENFLAALRADTNTNKKVIQSGSEDNIYIYMSGLGQDGAFQFPEKALSPDALIGTLGRMHEQRRFSKMVIFMESSYSAATFEGLPNTIDVYALASCGKNTELRPTDFNEKLNVFLSDQFSHAWLEDLSTADFSLSTFNTITKARQSKYLEQHSEEICPCQFGNTNIATCHLSEFLEE